MSTNSNDKSRLVLALGLGLRTPGETSTLRAFDDDGIFLVEFLVDPLANTEPVGLKLASWALSCFRKNFATNTGKLQTIRETQFLKWDPMI
jgi:hypothetical protein